MALCEMNTFIFCGSLRRHQGKKLQGDGIMCKEAGCLSLRPTQCRDGMTATLIQI